MSVVEFDALPDSARLWIYAANRRFVESEISRLNTNMSAFLHEWTAHRKELRTGWRLLDSQFILVAVDESMTTASGCSIDGLVRHLTALEKELRVQVLGTSMLIFFRDEAGAVKCTDRQDFRKMIESGTVSHHTTVYNNMIQSLGELRSGKWRVPLADSWHAEAFPEVFKASNRAPESKEGVQQKMGPA